MNEFEMMALAWLGFEPKESLIAWLENTIRKRSVDDIPYQWFDFISDFSTQDIHDYLKTCDPNFVENGVSVEIVLAKYLKLTLQQYLEGKFDECTLCCDFSEVEEYFLSTHQRAILDNIIYYPEWLSGWYGICDWCEETKWTPENQRNFREEIHLIISKIENCLNYSTEK